MRGGDPGGLAMRARPSRTRGGRSERASGAQRARRSGARPSGTCGGSGLSRRAVLRLLGATTLVVFAARGLARRLVGDRSTGPVIPVAELDEERIGVGDGLAG